jgi:hypothetical protein
LTLIAARLWLRLASGHAVGWATRRHTTSVVAAHSHAALDAMARAIVGVSVRGPLTFSCLEQSLALVIVSALARVPVRLVIGVNRAPFAAHAWVECDGRILLGGLGAHGMTPLTGTAASPCRG